MPVEDGQDLDTLLGKTAVGRESIEISIYSPTCE